MCFLRRKLLGAVAACLLGTSGVSQAALTLKVQVGANEQTFQGAQDPATGGLVAGGLVLLPSTSPTVFGSVTATSNAPGGAEAVLNLQNFSLFNSTAATQIATITLTEDGFTNPGGAGDTLLLSGVTGTSTAGSAPTFSSEVRDAQGQVVTSGTFIRGGSFVLTSLFRVSLDSGITTFSNFQTRASFVASPALSSPEPATVTLALLGLPIGAIVAWRRRRTAA